MLAVLTQLPAPDVAPCDAHEQFAIQEEHELVRKLADRPGTLDAHELVRRLERLEESIELHHPVGG